MTILKLIIWDCDGTLTTVKSVWQWIHENLGTWEEGGKLHLQDFSEGNKEKINTATNITMIDNVITMTNNAVCNRTFGIFTTLLIIWFLYRNFAAVSTIRIHLVK